MPAFVRHVRPRQASWPEMPGGIAQMAQSGRVQLRNGTQVGRVWRELYGWFDPNTIAGRAFLAQLNAGWRSQTIFTVDHPVLRTQLGAGGGTPVLLGGPQSGASLATNGWPASTTVLRRGDIVRFGGRTLVHDVDADVVSNGAGEATLTIEPPLYAAIAGGTAILTNTAPGVLLFSARLAAVQMPTADPHAKVGGLELTWAEVPG